MNIVKIIDTANPPTDHEWSRKNISRNWRPAGMTALFKDETEVLEIQHNGQHVRFLVRRNNLNKREAAYVKNIKKETD